ncbi:MAG: N-acetylglucosaminyl deacetylase, LmbE family [Candidatus Krumholzibacteriota bacterium]|nr:N-acetylglucosaminyl deacetylase, LmbE family [Candidatus Krumholzibacteriota bacterium]
MTEKPATILGVFSHPDDESMGPGGTLAKYAAEGHRVAFVTATDGGAGRLFDERPDDAGELRALRRRETLKAARILGIEFLGFLGWHDGRLTNTNVLEIETRFARIIRQERPDVVITFHGSGISYHADHRVVALALQGAFFGAGRRGWYRDEAVEALPPHATPRLYYYTLRRSFIDKVDWPRVVYASPDDEITTVIDTARYADARWSAIQAHESQKEGPPFAILYEAGMFAEECFVRVFPTWRAGDPLERALVARVPAR